MWTDYYIKTNDFGQFMSLLPAEWLTEDGFLDASFHHAFDYLGTIFAQDGQAIAGCHINLRLRATHPMPDSLTPFLIDTPAYPKRVFAV